MTAAAPLVVTPQTKLLDLLEAYPRLEELLVARVPAFEKLKNPDLRRTVAGATTLQQAAAVGGLPVAELVNLFRREIGQDLLSGAAGPAYVAAPPAWFDPARLAPPVDAGAMLAAGEQPVHRVLTDLKELPPGRIYTLVAPFLPAPLLDKATSLGFAHYVVEEPGGRFTVHFHRE